MSKSRLNILIAGGGTGGHLFPGISIAQEFLKANSNSKILFAGTDRQFEKTILQKAGFDHKSIKIAGLKGMGFLKKIKTAIMLPSAVLQSAFIIFRFKADLIVGVGGYSSGPVALAAWFLRKKIVLHEQNIIPGITNKILTRFADRIYVSFSETANHFSMTTVKTSGNPVRNEILAIEQQERKSSAPFTVLVSGGSQGAHNVNEAVCESLTFLDNKNDYQFIHQTGINDVEMVESTYVKEGVSCTVQPFFDDMEKQYEKADLIICRAGATTIAEITAMGHKSILIPFPHAADNHQEKNGQILVNKNAAEMITEDVLTGKLLADKIISYSKNPEKLATMGQNSREYGKPKAASTIVEDCYELLKG